MGDLERIDVNRTVRKWSNRELLGRVLWSVVSPLFKFSPRLCWGWRRWLLRVFGAKIGKEVQIYPSVQVFIPWNLEIGDWSSVGFDAVLYNLGKMRIGQRVTVSQRAHLCGGSHDYRDPTMPLLKSSIDIGDDVWLAADSFVGPDVSVGNDAIVGARAVVMKPVPAGAVVVGNPGRVIRFREKEDVGATFS